MDTTLRAVAGQPHIGGSPAGARWGAIRPFRRTARIDPSLALDPGQSVLDPGLRPGAPRHGEELEPLLDEEGRVHPGRDEIHPRDDAVLRGGRRDFIERSLIEVALVVEWHPQLDRKMDGPISRTSTPGTEAIASRFSSAWFVSIIGTITTPSFTASR